MAEQRLGFIVIGASGYMANENALPGFATVKNRLQNRGIDLQFVAAADPNLYTENHDAAFECRDKLKSHMAALGICQIHRNAEFAFYDAAQHSRHFSDFPKKIVCYDASPTSFHERHLHSTRDWPLLGIHYFGEKPIFQDYTTHLDSMKDAGNFPTYYCNFIETKNPAVRAIKRYLSDNDFDIQKVRCWRAGSSGLKHLVGHNQIGVEGGSFLDKAPHDLSIFRTLIENDEIESVDISSAEIETLIPTRSQDERMLFLPVNNGEELLSESDVFFNFRDEDRGSRMNLPADGIMSASYEVALKGKPRSIHVDLLSSWIGLTSQTDACETNATEQSFVEQLQALGIPESDWVFSELFHGDDNGDQLSCIETQARILIIDGYIESKRHLIVASLMNCEPDEALQRSRLERWVKVYENGDDGPKFIRELELDIAESYQDQKRRDIADVIEDVCLDVLGVKEAKDLKSEAVNDVHQMLIGARDQAYLRCAGEEASLIEKSARFLNLVEASIFPTSGFTP